VSDRDLTPEPVTRYPLELATATELARSAGLMAVELRAQGPQALAVEHKAGDEPVTVADRAASEEILMGLARELPDDVVISEEGADDPARLTAERVWFVDPIDGTRDFIAGREGFAVMIGLCIAGRPVVGVVYQPTQDRMFWAAPDVGAWFEAPGVAPRRLRVSDVSEPSQLRMVASRSHRSSVIDEVKSALGIQDEVNIGSVGLKLGLIALAERDLYVNPWPRCKAWDTCAPEAILLAAGGVLTDTRGEPLRYDEAELARPHGLVASNGKIHDLVLARVRPLVSR
jgi:3'(2'), 5'-bisphosphate nucleotidase